MPPRRRVSIADALGASVRDITLPLLHAPRPLAFRGGPLEVQGTTSPEWLLEGAADTTKTTAGLTRLDADLRRTPQARAVICRLIRNTMGTTVLGTWDRVIERLGGVTVYGGESPQWYDYPNGARVWIAGMDDADKVLGGEFDFVYASQVEEFSLDSWEKLSTRVTGRGAVTLRPWLGGDANPGHPKHWIKTRSRLKLIHARHEDNPELFDELGRPTAAYPERMAPLDALTGVRKERLRHGRWVAAEGAVYESFGSEHLVPRFEIPSSWRRIRSIDFGYTNPFVCQWWAIDPDGRIYLYREIYRTQRLAEDHARDIVRLSGQERIEATVADHDAEDRATLERHGVTTRPALKAVTTGIQAVQKRIELAGDRRPRLFVLEGSLVERDESLASARDKPVCTLDEFGMYLWAKSADGKPLKEDPVKLNDHGMDAMRYAVTYLDGGPPQAGPIRVYPSLRRNDLF